MVAIQSKFIGDFKLGDNINHNLDILELLYHQYDAADEQGKRLLCKPIILLLVSIIDAALYDLHTRIREFTNEGVQNVVASSANYIRGLKNMDKFEKCIASARKHALLDPPESVLYAELDDLRRLRNRIHIQNTKNDFERDEYDAFSDDRKILAERVLEKTLRTMADKYPRKHNYVNEFKLPWDTYFPSQ